jgi:hypothetical protein
MWDVHVRNGIGRRRLQDLAAWDIERFRRNSPRTGFTASTNFNLS